MNDATPTADSVAVRVIGQVESALTETGDAPRQPDEGAPPARIVLDKRYRAGLDGIGVGDALVVLTWLHLADRDVLTTRPRSELDRPLTGVFATRSPHRPNPIGLHEVTVTAVGEQSIDVAALEAIDGTPVIDIKSSLGPLPRR
ncbi:MAG: tRNA (N6-threonylcarbamoyladenosine(37)-N6)-methyltransferase TrmO [Acidimicrobiia bacterium]